MRLEAVLCRRNRRFDRVTRVILASASPRRRELLAALIDDFEVEPSGVEEPWEDDLIRNAMNLARAKAEDVYARHPGTVVIGADTIVFEGGKPYGKPEDAEDALAIWRALRGKEHFVVTGIAVVTDGGETTGHTVSRVELTNLSEAEVREYIASGRPMDKAGAYAIQDEDVPTVARLDGCYCAVMGLGLWDVHRMLARTGIAARTPDRTFERCRQSCAARR